MRFPPPRSTPAVPPTPSRRKRRKWPLILLLLLLLCYVAFSLGEARLNGMVSTSFDLNSAIRSLVGNGAQSGTAGTPVAAPGGTTPEGPQRTGSGAAAGGDTTRTGGGGGQQQPPGGGGNGGVVQGNGGGTAPDGTIGSGTAPAGGGIVGTPEGGTVQGNAGGTTGTATTGTGTQGASPTTGIATGGPGPAGPGGGGARSGAQGTSTSPATGGSTLSVRLVARDGTELYPRFHFEDGTARLMLEERHFTPGFYTLYVTRTDTATGHSDTASQEFAWGVLAMNTDKDRYRQNETSHIDFGVLDENGAIVCDAALTLAVTLPDGTREELSTAGGGIRVTGTCGRKEGGLLSPDYEADLPLPLVGDYQLELTAVRPDATAHATSTITSTLKVVTAPPYLIRRTAATRLWPFAPSTMDIDVEFLQDFTGTITDVVPQGFSVISTTPTAAVGPFPGGNDIAVAWAGTWHAGETAHLHYVYDAPDISPQFYLVGPLQMDGAAGHDEELRSWEIANDDAGATANYKITSDVLPGGGAETARSTNYILSDTIGEPIAGFGASPSYQLNAGYRQTTQPALTTLSLGCPATTTLGTIAFSGQQTGSGTCTVTTDNPTGYSLAWTAGSNNANGLVGYWKFDETTGTTAYDDSGNGNNGTLTNGPTISTSVPSNYFSTRSISFDGANDYVDLGQNVGNFTLASTFTISAWINPTLDSTDHIIYGNSWGNIGYLLRVTSSNKLRLILVGNNGGGIFNGIDSNTLSVGWHHVVGVWDGSSPKVYVDGASQSITPITAGVVTTITTSANTRIGASPESGNEKYFKGNIDEVRIYSRALSPAEIQDLASKTPPGAMTASGSQLNNIPPYSLPATGGLVGHWRMDERTAGSTVADSSGQGNDGTPNGAGGANNKPQPTTSVPSGTNFRNSRSLSFDGTDDYLSAPNLTLTGNQATFSAWVNPTDFANYRDLVKNIGNPGSGQFYCFLNITTGAISCNFAGNAFTTVPVSAGVWSHIVATYNAGITIVYVNGVQVGTTVGSNNSFNFTGVNLGAQSTGGSEFFKGPMDDVRVYNRALSAAEVKALYGTPQTWSVAATDAGFGSRLRSTSTDTDSKWGTDGSSDKWLNIGDGSYPLVSRTSATATGGSLEVFQYRAEVGASKIQPTGLYQSTVTYTASAL